MGMERAVTLPLFVLPKTALQIERASFDNDVICSAVVYTALFDFLL